MYGVRSVVGCLQVLTVTERVGIFVVEEDWKGRRMTIMRERKVMRMLRGREISPGLTA
jgi:hypothetical protein